MSSASLAVARRPQPDMVRIAALSAAIAFNLAALLFALRPLAPQFAAVIETSRPTTIDFHMPPPKVEQPPAIDIKPFHKPVPVVAPKPVVHQQPLTPPVIAPTVTEPSHNALPSAPPSTQGPPSIAPGVVSLAYRSAPLKFPAQAARMHMQGTVLLRVLVDETGKPVDVVVEHTSGYPLLDKSARDQVLGSWQFQPAVIDGHAVKAWARVPVDFALQEM
ncbi:energy transducer TonB [Dyella sp. 2HG41-7]|uniref:energy transducer TonB n=1 Tax=Dyella sp. 2HG41-7 TaxID=2883239 RepID=UPI001F291E4B|nr:energy transducer TonB [Dyella sp. 2HG41-7]